MTVKNQISHQNEFSQQRERGGILCQMGGNQNLKTMSMGDQFMKAIKWEIGLTIERYRKKSTEKCGKFII